MPEAAEFNISQFKDSFENEQPEVYDNTPDIDDESKEDSNTKENTKKEEELGKLDITNKQEGNKAETKIEGKENKQDKVVGKVEGKVEDDTEVKEFEELAKSILELRGLEQRDENGKSIPITLRENSIEAFNEIIDDAIEHEAKIRSENVFVNNLSRKFNDFLGNGGNPNEFFEVNFGNDDYTNIEAQNDNDKAYIVKEHYLKTTKFSEQKIDKLINQSIEDGELDDEYKNAKEELVKYSNNKKVELLAKQEQINKENNLKIANWKKDIETKIFTSNDLAGIKLNDQNRKSFMDFFLGTNKETGNTNFQDVLNANPELGIEAAFLIHNKLNTGEFFPKELKQSVLSKVKQALNQTAQRQSGIENKPKQESKEVDYVSLKNEF